MMLNFITKPLHQLQTFVMWRIFRRKKNTIPILNSWIAELPNGEFITSLHKPKNSKYKFKRIKLEKVELSHTTFATNPLNKKDKL